MRLLHTASIYFWLDGCSIALDFLEYKFSLCRRINVWICTLFSYVSTWFSQTFCIGFSNMESCLWIHCNIYIKNFSCSMFWDDANKVFNFRCSEEDKDAYLYYILCVHGQGQSIVFCSSITALRHITALLRTLQISVSVLHGEMQQRARLKVCLIFLITWLLLFCYLGIEFLIHEAWCLSDSLSILLPLLGSRFVCYLDFFPFSNLSF